MNTHTKYKVVPTSLRLRYKSHDSDFFCFLNDSSVCYNNRQEVRHASRPYWSTHFCRIRHGRGAAPPPPPPPPDNFWRTKLTPTNCISYRRVRFILDIDKVFWFCDFMINFRKMLRKGSAMVPEKMSNFWKYEHIIYHIKAHDLEIPLI